MEKTRYNLPIFDMMIDEDSVGLYTISLVDDPAMEVSWYAFDNQDDSKLKVKLANIMDDKEHKVMVVICRADFPILRRDDAGRFFYIKFSKETIKMMAQRFLKNGYQGLVNLMHDEDAYVEGVEMEQIFVKDVENGINPIHFSQIEDGSLFAVYKIENDAIWEDIMNGKYNSVSLEGLFKPVLVEEKTDELNTIDEFVDYINN